MQLASYKKDSSYRCCERGLVLVGHRLLRVLSTKTVQSFITQYLLGSSRLQQAPPSPPACEKPITTTGTYA